VKVNNGMGNSKFVVSLVYSGNDIYAGIRSNGIYKSTDNGTSWAQIFHVQDSSVYSLAANGNIIFAGLAFLGNGGSGVYRSTDAGATWEPVGLFGKNIVSLAVYGDTVFAGTNGLFGVYRSTNNGTNWSQTSLSNLDVRAFTKSGNILFSGTGQDSGVYKSTNNGTNWAQTSLNYRSIISLVSNANYIYAGASGNNGVYRSTDAGATWTQTSLNNRQVNSLAINGINIFAGTPNTGVYVSNDTGTSWIQRNEGFGFNPNILAVIIFNNFIYVGTQDSSVYRRPLDDLIGIQPISHEVPSGFSLKQNYPNPFNPNTKIQFDISKSTFTKLSIYDVIGRVVAILVNEDLKPGVYQVSWDASHTASGVYYYKLETESYSETKKMILLK
jgi:photosystem II stability/assembly factor-like uncharacterized protein